MAGMVGLWGASSLVKSVQSGLATTTNSGLTATATINAVDTANSVCFFRGNVTSDATNGQVDGYQKCYVSLTNATTVTVTRYTQDGNGTVSGYFTVVEFMPGVLRSVQFAAVTLTAALSNTATITAVNTNKSVVFVVGGFSNQGALAVGTNHWCQATLTNATTVTVTRNGASNIEGLGVLVLEFF